MLNRMEIRDTHGVRTESTYVSFNPRLPFSINLSLPHLFLVQRSLNEPANASPTYYERFKEAFVNEVNAFTDAVLDNTRKSIIVTT